MSPNDSELVESAEPASSQQEPILVDVAVEPIVAHNGRAHAPIKSVDDGRSSTWTARRLAWLVAALVVLAAGGFIAVAALGNSETGDSDTNEPPSTAQVQVRDLSESRDYTGELQYDGALDLAAGASGFLTSLAEDGSILERGDVAYSLSNDPSEAELLAAEQRLVSAESQLATASEQLSTSTEGPSASDLSSAQAGVAQAQLALERLTEAPSEAALTAAKAKLAQAEAAYTDLFDGVSDAEAAALNNDVARAQQSYQQAQAGVDLAWISLLAAQAGYCSLPTVPVADLCGSADIPLTDTDVVNLTAAVTSALGSGDNATVQAIQSFISASSSYENAVTSANAAASALSDAQASLGSGSAGPDQWQIDQALAAILQAEDDWALLNQGPSALEVTQAEANLSSAEARLDDLLEGATPAQRQQASAAVESARLSLEISQLEFSQLVAAPTSVSIFYGSEISWRTLSLGSSPGADVRQLEENLEALGFAPEGMAVDDIFDGSTELAVIAWQTSLGTTADGSVSPFELIYVPGPVKIGSPAEGVELGSSVPVGSLITDLVPVSRVVIEGDGSETLASTQQIVVTVPVDDRDLIEVGTSVVVELADGTDIDATVISIAAPVSGDSGSTVSVVIAPTVSIDDAWTGTSVSVEVTTEVSSGVLAVPVSALLALVEGGYALEVVQSDGSTELIGVETGMFADGLVEVTATGLIDGMNVVVPG